MNNIKKTIKEKISPSKHYLQQSLKLWDTVGYDRECGGYFEALTFDGKPLKELNKRFRIHPRTIFSHAAGTVLGYYDGLSTAEKAFEHITSNWWLKEGGFATSANRQGDITDDGIFTYDHAFVMLGFGWLYKASKNAIHKQWLYDVWDMLNSRLIHADGGFITSIPQPHSPIRVQNPHMHMLEALLNLIELFGDDIWIDGAKRMYKLFHRHFALPHEGKLRESFNDDWTPDVRTGNILEPGHHYEWVWILEKYERLLNTKIDMIDPLFEFAIHASNADGLGYNSTDYNGKPIHSEHRMWIQTEVIKANIAMYRRTKHEKYLHTTLEAWKILFSKYLIEGTWTWYDELDDEGNNISNNAPTSTLYHLLIALDEFINFAQSL